MFRISRVLTLTTAVLAAATLAGAQTSSTPTKSAPAKSAPAKSATMKPAAGAAKPTTLVASGKLAKFDAASNMLTVTTTKGDVMFMLTPTAKLTEGTKVLKPADLSGLTGLVTRVQYTEKDGAKTAASVKVTAAAPATKAATPAASKKKS